MTMLNPAEQTHGHEPRPDVSVLDVVRFCLELALVAAAYLAGAAAHPTLAVAAPAAVIAVWSRWIASRSSHRLQDPARLATEVGLFLVTGSALAAATSVVAGAALAIASTAVAVAIRR